MMLRKKKKCFIGKKVFDKNVRVFVAWNISPVFVIQHNRTEVSDRPAVFVQPNSSRNMCVFRLPRSKGDSTLRLDATPHEGRINSFTWKKKSSGTLRRRCEPVCGHESQDVGRVCDKMMHLELYPRDVCVHRSLSGSRLYADKGTAIMGVDLRGRDENHSGDKQREKHLRRKSVISESRINRIKKKKWNYKHIRLQNRLDKE